jgi:hypothetical protein
MTTHCLTRLLPTLQLTCLWLAAPVSARTLRFASAFDPNSPNIEVVPWPSDVLELRWVRIGGCVLTRRRSA